MIYLDHNATTETHPQVLELISDLMKSPFNASSVHTSGRKAKSIIENARMQIASLLKIDLKNFNYQIIFTSTGTEANNLMLSNFKDADIFISATEHMSIYAHTEYLPNIKTIKVDSNGIIDLEDLTNLLVTSTNDKKLVSVMLANNETGVIQPIEEVVEIATKFSAIVHSDLVQAVGKIDVDIGKLGLDFATISGHKFGGIQGAGALIAKSRHTILPMIIGGGQEKGIRSGSENVPAIAAMGMAATILKRELDERHLKMKSLQERLEQKLPNVRIVAKDVLRLPNTSLIINSGRLDAATQLIALDLRGFAVSSGAACSSGKAASDSHVLSAMGIAKSVMRSAIRVSLSYNNNFDEIDSFVKAINEINSI
jgi:cysteine desulfurase